MRVKEHFKRIHVVAVLAVVSAYCTFLCFPYKVKQMHRSMLRTLSSVSFPFHIFS